MSTAVYALSVGEERKRAAHSEACHAVGVTFIPMVVETLGGWGEEAALTVKNIGPPIGNPPPAQATQHLFQRLAINLWRGNATLWIRRLPTRSPEVDGLIGEREQGVVTPIVRVGPFATGVKMQSRGQAGFLALVKRSRGLSGSVNGQDQLSPKPIPTPTGYTHDFVYTVYLSRLTSQLPAHALVQTGLTFHPFWNRTPSLAFERALQQNVRTRKQS